MGEQREKVVGKVKRLIQEFTTQHKDSPDTLWITSSFEHDIQAVLGEYKPVDNFLGLNVIKANSLVAVGKAQKYPKFEVGSEVIYRGPAVDLENGQSLRYGLVGRISKAEAGDVVFLVEFADVGTVPMTDAQLRERLTPVDIIRERIKMMR